MLTEARGRGGFLISILRLKGELSEKPALYRGNTVLINSEVPWLM